MHPPVLVGCFPDHLLKPLIVPLRQSLDVGERIGQVGGIDTTCATYLKPHRLLGTSIVEHHLWRTAAERKQREGFVA